MEGYPQGGRWSFILSYFFQSPPTQDGNFLFAKLKHRHSRAGRYPLLHIFLCHCEQTSVCVAIQFYVFFFHNFITCKKTVKRAKICDVDKINKRRIQWDDCCMLLSIITNIKKRPFGRFIFLSMSWRLQQIPV